MVVEQNGAQPKKRNSKKEWWELGGAAAAAFQRTWMLVALHWLSSTSSVISSGKAPCRLSTSLMAVSRSFMPVPDTAGWVPGKSKQQQAAG